MKILDKSVNAQFRKDLKEVREVMVRCHITGAFLKTYKNSVLKAAERAEISYYITDAIFKVKRKSMVIQ